MYVCMVYMCMQVHKYVWVMDLLDMFSTHGVFVCDKKLVRAWSTISSVWTTNGQFWKVCVFVRVCRAPACRCIKPLCSCHQPP